MTVHFLHLGGPAADQKVTIEVEGCGIMTLLFQWDGSDYVLRQKSETERGFQRLMSSLGEVSHGNRP